MRSTVDSESWNLGLGRFMRVLLLLKPLATFWLLLYGALCQEPTTMMVVAVNGTVNLDNGLRIPPARSSKSPY